MMNQDETRRAVSAAYGKAVSTSTPVRCCGSREQKGVAVQYAGYDERELATLPPDALVNAFGCGNPLESVDIRPGQVVLDLGSGAGIDLLLAAKRVGPAGRAIGVDMTDEMLAKAHQVIAESGLKNVEVRRGIIEDLPVESETVDWVISNCVINLSPEKDRVFAEIARVLKPGGRVRISDLVAEGLPENVRGSLLAYCSCVAGALSRGEYIAGLKNAGLVDVEVRERVTYDLPKLLALLESDLPVGEGACCSPASNDAIRKLAEACSGRVASVEVAARKSM